VLPVSTVLWAARATRQLLLRLVWYAEGWWRDQSDPDRLADACRDADRRSLLGHLGIGAPLQRYVLGGAAESVARCQHAQGVVVDVRHRPAGGAADRHHSYGHDPEWPPPTHASCLRTSRSPHTSSRSPLAQLIDGLKLVLRQNEIARCGAWQPLAAALCAGVRAAFSGGAAVLQQVPAPSDACTSVQGASGSSCRRRCYR
jgi:hypothetical protein